MACFLHPSSQDLTESIIFNIQKSGLPIEAVREGELMTGVKFYDTADGNFADLARAAQVRFLILWSMCVVDRSMDGLFWVFFN